VIALPDGIVKVRLTGAREDRRELAAILASVTLERRDAGTETYLTVGVRVEVTDCGCGKQIRPCDCGDDSCAGWIHTGRPGGHWCGDWSGDGRALPAGRQEGEQADG
jgi:hypothetical protein